MSLPPGARHVALDPDGNLLVIANNQAGGPGLSAFVSSTSSNFNPLPMPVGTLSLQTLLSCPTSDPANIYGGTKMNGFGADMSLSSSLASAHLPDGVDLFGGISNSVPLISSLPSSLSSSHLPDGMDLFRGINSAPLLSGGCMDSSFGSLVSAPLGPMNGVFGNSNVAGMNFSQ